MNEQVDLRGRVSAPSPVCGQCGSSHVTRSTERDEFEYGTGEAAVKLVAPVPVYRCSDCLFQFTTESAEVLRHEAVCKHLDVLSPAQIASIRGECNLTRERFADLTGIGVASLARWENGQLVQSKSQDRYLRLLRFPENIRRLRGSESDTHQRSGVVVCIVVTQFPEGYKGMRFPYCYHCKTNSHIKSGGCWTVKYAKEKLGKRGYIIEIHKR